MKKTETESRPRKRAHRRAARAAPGPPGGTPAAGLPSVMLRHGVEAEVHEIDDRVDGHVAQGLAGEIERRSEHPGRGVLAVEHPGQKEAGLAPHGHAVPAVSAAINNVARGPRGADNRL